MWRPLAHYIDLYPITDTGPTSQTHPHPAGGHQGEGGGDIMIPPSRAEGPVRGSYRLRKQAIEGVPNLPVSPIAGLTMWR